MVQGGFVGGLDGRRVPARVMPKKVSSVVGKDGYQTKCQELGVFSAQFTLPRRETGAVVLTRIVSHIISDTHTKWLQQAATAAHQLQQCC